MSRKSGKSPKLDLKLNLSSYLMRFREGPSTRAVVGNDDLSPKQSPSPSPPISPLSSCVSSEGEQKQSNSPGATSMVLAGCPQCLMYVMLSEEDPKCPKCKSSVLLDFNHPKNNAHQSRKR